MAKDALGHGSDSQGGGSKLTNSAQEKVALGKAVDAGHFPPRSAGDIAAAQSLGGHPKSAPVAVHNGAAGRIGRLVNDAFGRYQPGSSMRPGTTFKSSGEYVHALLRRP